MTILVLSRGPTPVLHRMTPTTGTASSSSNNDDHDHHSPTPLVAMACTGLAGDAQWLIRKVQTRLLELWEIYDHFVTSLPVLAHGISHWCNVYRTSGLVGRPTPSLWASSSSSSNDEWTRPLGVQVLLVSTSTSTSTPSSTHHHNHPNDPLYLLSMPPTGRIHRGKRPLTATATATTTTTNSAIVKEYLCLGGPEVQRNEWETKCQTLNDKLALGRTDAASTNTRSDDDNDDDINTTLIDTIVQTLGLNQPQQRRQQGDDPNNNPLWIETLHPNKGLIQRKYIPQEPPSRRR
eukprot:Nitzschia sp. Nitz4//scaffold154_size52827//36427//37302//NITZ4_006781-RA/size52827-processed-gene-0.76-mRNA-1//1//CDS//3329537323//680//frame0